MPTEFGELLKRHEICHQVRDYIAHFANPVRLRILCELLVGEASVGELVEAIGIRQPTVSQHLKHLRLAGLVARHSSGNRRVYRVADPIVSEAMEFFASIARRIVKQGAIDASVA